MAEIAGRGPGARTPEAILRDYFHAKDENRPHLLSRVFAETATLEMIVNTGAIAFPPVSRGREAIADVLVRRFAQAYENVYSFYLDRPPAGQPVERFACDWLVGMSEKETGAVRVGCGRYDWRFQPGAPHLAERLVIRIEAMEVLGPEALAPLMRWLTALPYPWCSAREALAAAPEVAGIEAVRSFLAPDRA